jgi:hypothetical protein
MESSPALVKQERVTIAELLVKATREVALQVMLRARSPEVMVGRHLLLEPPPAKPEPDLPQPRVMPLPLAWRWGPPRRAFFALARQRSVPWRE